MIITLNMDTEKDRDTCKKVLELVLGFGGSVDLEVVGQPRAVKRLYKDIWPTEDAEFKKPVNNEPTKKRRGRPPKIKKDIYTLAREKTARRNA
ncbi:hypothetical protein [uncultured Fibrobacter sp.]|uniref:hypothetical protein n=1 Tax=uncultured Fibrobacter sp. TaxID=261512 RepID=UPI0025DBD87A|nr:hypothetical protein [uncultured Fibrobacter sp.]